MKIKIWCEGAADFKLKIKIRPNKRHKTTYGFGKCKTSYNGVDLSDCVKSVTLKTDKEAPCFEGLRDWSANMQVVK